MFIVHVNLDMLFTWWTTKVLDTVNIGICVRGNTNIRDVQA